MPETSTRTVSSDAARFAIRNRIAEVIRGEDGDTDVTPVELAERIMSQFDVRELRPYSTGGVIRGADLGMPGDLRLPGQVVPV